MFYEASEKKHYLLEEQIWPLSVVVIWPQCDEVG
jgi:hypothetical protein